MLGATVGVVGIIVLELWHGPTVLALSGGHGVDTGDLLAVPLVVLAIAAARRRFALLHVPRGWAGPVSALLLGALLMLVGVVAKSGGPLVPAGGATLDGNVSQTFGTRSVPVNRWSYLAVTYDGATLRLFVDGDQVSNRPSVSGAIEAPDSPLWIGGNRPYGEHFDGVIDEVRVYDRALTQGEIAHDMVTPVSPTSGLVAAYAFDTGSGNVAVDSSGHRATGEIRGATWAPGRYGEALRFDAGASVVKVPASPTLNLMKAMTLSGWIQPDSAQTGWRTIIQRQTDAYFLTASSSPESSGGRVDDLRAVVLVAVAGWFGVMIATGRAPVAAARRRTWWLALGLFAVGSLLDAVFAPTGTLIGPALVAVWLTATASSRAELVVFMCGAAVCVGLTFGSLTGITGLDTAISAEDDGAVARSVALGALLMLVGLAALFRPRRDPTTALATASSG